jgi:hypothetical protein
MAFLCQLSSRTGFLHPQRGGRGHRGGGGDGSVGGFWEGMVWVVGGVGHFVSGAWVLGRSGGGRCKGHWVWMGCGCGHRVWLG